MKALLVRRERADIVRNVLISSETEFFEEAQGFHYLFVIPSSQSLQNLEGKWCYLTDGSIDEIAVEGKTFKIEGGRDTIDRFAPKFEARGMKVRLEGPDAVIYIRRWNKKFLVSVSGVSH